MRKIPPFTALRAFEAVSRHESVTQAAAELNVSHSAVSQQLRLLEGYFSRKLVRKAGNRIELTPAARSYAHDVRKSLDLLAVASEDFASSGSAHCIRINATPSFAMRWLIPRIAAFQRLNPRIEIRLETSNTDEFESSVDQTDLVIRRYPMKKAGLACRHLLDDEAVAVVSPVLLSELKVRHAKDLMRCPLLHMKSRISAWPDWFRKAGIDISQTPRGQVFDHFFLCIEAAINGYGIALVPEALVSLDIAEQRLGVLFPQARIIGSGFYGLFNPSARKARSVEQFITWLTQED
ncbi:LysR substrate-binding domain-containing protein [Bradyrhizobium retamae]|uniref:HTH lysR-type domain-containing protein n=1 Tax=Bradyrhizobium retamae TaxID=1300035 RepID=A0A0R3NBC2_9BRAD|nr:LysR substrate-binding domain-containing protein [Bradyrhizobium retamae]KRR29639.1 hypothetical protein CQ13_38320 [Bradyrhizobium retamae]